MGRQKGRSAVCRDKAMTRWEEVSVTPKNNNTQIQAVQAKRELVL